MVLIKVFFFTLLLASSPAYIYATLDSRTKLPNARLAHEVKQIPTDAAQPKCAPSVLGYECSWLVCDRIRLHWSLGGPPPNGTEPCTYAGTNRTSTAGALNASATEVHFAVQSELPGYVAMSFALLYGVMVPADAVIGQVVDNMGMVTPYFVEGYLSKDLYKDRTINLTHSAIISNATTMTMCFTRQVAQKGQAAVIAQAPVDFTLAEGNFTMMNFVAGFSPFPAIHSMSEGRYMCSAALPLIAKATGEPADRTWVPSGGSHHSQRGRIVDPVAAQKEVQEYMTTHGLLMATAWLFLMPMGLLAARHKSLITEWFDGVPPPPSGSDTAPLVGGKPPNQGVGGALWFLLHRVLQGSAAILSLAGFIIPFTSFDEEENGNPVPGQTSRHHESHLLSARIHSLFGIGLTVVLGVHLVLALARPKPDAPRRRVWFLLHLWAGRLMVVVAAINVAIGISLWRLHVGEDGVNLWIALLVLLVVGYVAFDAFLTLVQRRREREASAARLPAGREAEEEEEAAAGGRSVGGELSMSRIVSNGGGLSGVMASSAGYDRVDIRGH